MKKRILFVILTVMVFVPPAHASHRPLKKLARGAVNVVTAPVEIPKQVRASWVEGAQKTDHIIVWLISGAVWGSVQTVKRAGSGVWDVVSFPFAKPQEGASLMQPPCVFEAWPRNPVSGR